jgi:small-conductance mechanosensitive channel
MITVDGRQGRVAKVTSRYVVLRALDGVEAIVPNETLVSTTVLNHSHASHDVRVATTVRIAYGADVEQALALMRDAAAAETRVLAAPEPPTAFVTGLGENGIDLELVLWIAGTQGLPALRSGIHRRILATFDAAGIAIPAARREIRISGMDHATEEDLTSVNPRNPEGRVK